MLKVKSYFCSIVGEISNIVKCDNCNCLLKGPEITDPKEIKYLERNNGHINCKGPYTTLQFLNDTRKKPSNGDLKILTDHGYDLNKTRFRDLPKLVREILLS